VEDFNLAIEEGALAVVEWLHDIPQRMKPELSTIKAAIDRCGKVRVSHPLGGIWRWLEVSVALLL
jgi:hypothetical protein